MLIKFIQKAVFGSGNQGINVQYQSRMVSFTIEGQRAVQYEIIRDIMEALWEGLIAVFGYPTFETGICTTGLIDIERLIFNI